MRNDCCRDCEKRSPGCHSRCPEYDEKARQEAWAKREKDTSAAAPFYAFKTDMVERTKKWVTR